MGKRKSQRSDIGERLLMLSDLSMSSFQAAQSLSTMKRQSILFVMNRSGLLTKLLKIEHRFGSRLWTQINAQSRAGWRMTMDERTFKRNPRDYAIELAETIGWKAVCEAFIHSLSHDDIRECLDENELSPRFNESDDEDCDDE